MNLTITKKIAKQGKNLVLIIPMNLHPYLNGGDLVRVSFNKMQAVLQEEKNDRP